MLRIFIGSAEERKVLDAIVAEHDELIVEIVEADGSAEVVECDCSVRKVSNATTC